MGRQIRHRYPFNKDILMQFIATNINGVFILEPEKQRDERGWFIRSYCAEEFAAHEIAFTTLQCNRSFNIHAGTLRGMHFQKAPYAEAKLVRCTSGRIFDVAVDLRKHSPSYLAWVGVELSADAGNAVFIPEGCAHGFLTLAAESEVFYQMGALYRPEMAGGARFDDPAFAIDWPYAPKVISERDQTWPDYDQ
jgi:dTDP-4-dehydrorhamnose 3,5-epimerase